MSTKCKNHICKKRLTTGITLGVIVLTITLTELLHIAQVNTPFLSSPTPF